MEIPDLTLLPPGHPPSPYGFPLPLKLGEAWGVATLPAGLSLKTVGWLGASVKSIGAVDDRIVDILLDGYETRAVFSDGTAGWHDCELCPGPEAWYPEGKVGPVIQWRGRKVRLYGHGHHLIRHQSTVYMAPALILHYILDHDYLPPEGFLVAVNEGDFLRPSDLLWEENSPGKASFGSDGNAS